MTAFRHHLFDRRRLAAWLVALALAMRLLVPVGYMVGDAGGAITIELCSGHAPRTMTMAMPGMAHRSGETHDHAKADMPCAFAALAAPALAGADPLLLEAAIGFIVATAFRTPSTPSAPARFPHLRPPLRGPPTHA